MKVIFFILTLLGSSLFTSVATATTPADIVCQPPEQVTEEQFQQLVTVGEQLINGTTKLEMPSSCPNKMSMHSQEITNPYLTALQVAAQTKTTDDLAQTLDSLVSMSLSMKEKGIKHSELLRYIKVACGNQLSCVTKTIHAMPHLKVGESPIFCAFSRMADYSLQLFFQTEPEAQYPVACLGYSTLTKGMGLSPMQDWFEAYKLLGKKNTK
ncbi:hypothetical protein [Pelistega europaea]|uniref:Uncharacterized protein n=1 Tax=Pelistega europaea TaxID=106147 RepID=A0A7Y4L826_9BURK|nr:hypothetical protein [Pelistega europaea]NOL48710.1 hypothetical protein [Pelistega europaea]